MGNCFYEWRFLFFTSFFLLLIYFTFLYFKKKKLLRSQCATIRGEIKIYAHRTPSLCVTVENSKERIETTRSWQRFHFNVTNSRPRRVFSLSSFFFFSWESYLTHQHHQCGGLRNLCTKQARVVRLRIRLT